MMPSIFGESLFDDFFAPDWVDNFGREMNRALAAQNPMGKHARNVMKTDVKQTDSSYELAVDLPGFKKDDVKVELKDGYLLIQAAKSHENDQKDQKGNYIRQERYTGSCARSFYVGDDMKPEDVNAKFEDGILKISLPRKDTKKLPESNPNLISIE
ncbi:MAG: Hsp20/alpha crystallin family protein [Oscillospiraceae bacterium]|jgi:HSP20 family protein|nr:Hsp20/alpha crystallin family protein [Oscillospiraceae bacterium]MDD3262017.1 Hsp20/alpha crystallin family protein [Oscillospiraceae bacterium]